MDLNQKRQGLLKIKERICLYNRQEKMLIREVQITNRKLHTKKLIQAGKLFEKAGILESYDTEEVLSALIKMKHQ